MARRAQPAETDFIFSGISTWTLVVFEGNARYTCEAAVCPPPVSGFSCSLPLTCTDGPDVDCSESSPHVLIPFISAQARYGRLGHRKQRTKQPWIPPRVPDQAEGCSVVRPLGERPQSRPAASNPTRRMEKMKHRAWTSKERLKPVGGLRPPRVSLAATV